MIGPGAWPGEVKLLALQPKKTGWLLRPRLIKVCCGGIVGKGVPFSIERF